MKHRILFLLSFLLSITSYTPCQDFGDSPVPFNPDNQVHFKMNLPIIHLDINNYEPSKRWIYAGEQIMFTFYNRNHPWTYNDLFMRVRWDNDLDASNGVSWSGWFDNQEENVVQLLGHTYATPGTYTITIEIEFYATAGNRQYSRVREYQLNAVPKPTAVYSDQYGNRLFHWIGNDGVYNKPVLMVEGFDPDNSTTPEVNYGLGHDLIELARDQNYDIFIMEWAGGGIDLSRNKEIFLGACQFLHRKLGRTDAGIQVVGISMGGTIARYGLAWAEDDINQNEGHFGQYIDHYVTTFISFDSPQQGAHVNTNLQEFIKDNGNAQQQAVLQSIAAKQMLYDDVYGSTHNTFYEGIKSLNNSSQAYGYTNGYPRRSKNFAVSNGNRNTNYPNKSTSDPLATLEIYTTLSLWGVFNIPVSSSNVSLLAQERDIWPGSTFTHDLTTLHAYGTRYIPSIGLSLLLTRAFASYRFNVNFNPSYTPTESAVDLEGYTRSANGSLIGGTSWFDDHLMQTTFHRHEELTEDSKTKVMEWLNNNLTRPYLAKPSQMKATAFAGNGIAVDFLDESAYEEGIAIERKAAGGTFAEIARVPANSTRYVDTDPQLQPFTTYYYRVRSYAGSQFSVYSSEVAAYNQPKLLSSTSTALSHNNQHRSARVRVTSGSDDHYLVYESGGGAFLNAHTTASGEEFEWIGERLIGGIPTPSVLENRNPSLIIHPAPSLHPLDTRINLIYQTVQMGTTSPTHSISYAKFPGWLEGSVQPAVTFTGITADASFQAMPVGEITRQEGALPALIALLWRNGNGMSMGFGYPTSEDYEWNSGGIQPQIIPSDATHPSIIGWTKNPSDIYNGDYKFYIVWEDATGIKARIGFIPNGASSPPEVSEVTWSTLFNVSPVNSATETHSHPTITMDASHNLVVAWEYRTPSSRGVRVKKYEYYLNTLWTVIMDRTFPFPADADPQAFAPIVSGLRDNPVKPNDLVLSWRTTQGLTAARYADGVWTAPYIIDPQGGTATLETNVGASNADLRVFYINKAANGPYAIWEKSVSTPVTVSAMTSAKWNMLSVPSWVGDFTGSSIYAGANSPVWHLQYTPNGNGGFTSSYVNRTGSFLQNGEAYWVKYPAAGSVIYTGTPFAQLSTKVYPGWNMVGSLSHSIGLDKVSTTPSQNLRTSAFFKVVNGGNVPVSTDPNILPNTIEPGYGYWAKFSGEGYLVYDNQASGGTSTQPPIGIPPLAFGAPQLLSPDSGSVDKPAALTLSWYSFGGAVGYWLQVSTSATFATTLINDNTITSNSRSVTGLSYNTIYYWRVKALGIEGTQSGWSDEWTFRTATPPPVPLAPVLLSPANASTNQNTTLYVSWNASVGASTYQVQLSRNTAFTQLVSNVSNITGTSQQVTSLSYSTTYYWRVNASNVSGTSPWSQVRSFTTKAAPPSDPCPTNATYASMDQVTIADATGNEQTLYMRNENFRLGDELSLDDEMPPEPPDQLGMFNARFHSGKFLEKIKPGNSKKMLPFIIKHAALPLTIRWKTKQENLLNLKLVKPKQGGGGSGNEEEVLMDGEGEMMIESLEGGKAIFIQAQASTPPPCEVSKTQRVDRPEETVADAAVEKPTEFRLLQNSPNPFNPTTTIQYHLAEDVQVSLQVFNMLGEIVETLVDGRQSAGYKQVNFDGINLPSGMYIYRLQAGSFTDSKKLLLVK